MQSEFLGIRMNFIYSYLHYRYVATQDVSLLNGNDYCLMQENVPTSARIKNMAWPHLKNYICIQTRSGQLTF